ncbi:MAG: molybdate ABC transporter substrate-binding protein [Gammaproteobacteria bacterium]
MRLVVLTAYFFFSLNQVALADKVLVAVASNALKALQSVKKEFEKDTGHKLQISSGSTGKLYAQIVNGAPYDVFLAANVREPEKLENTGFIVNGSRFTYARGKLALCSTTLELDEVKAKQLLTSGKFNRLALASPRTAPYGAAAKQVLEKLSAWKQNKRKFIKGENISQAYQFTASGNVELGFVALAQTWKNKISPFKTCWDVPESYYSPLEQQAVWLKRGKNNPVAKEFVDYLKSGKVKNIFSNDFGYGT